MKEILSKQLQKLIETKLDENYHNTVPEQAKGMDIPYPTLMKYIKAETTCSIDNVVKIAKYYSVSTDYLLGLSDIPHKSYNELENDYSRLLSKIKQFKERFSDLNDYVNKEL